MPQPKAGMSAQGHSESRAMGIGRFASRRCGQSRGQRAANLRETTSPKPNHKPEAELQNQKPPANVQPVQTLVHGERGRGCSVRLESGNGAATDHFAGSPQTEADASADRPGDDRPDGDRADQADTGTDLFDAVGGNATLG